MISDSFLSTLEKYNMIADTQTIIIGLSGGADSVALTHLFCSISKRKKLKIIAVHLNHQLRACESQRDENFVKKFCEHMGIELIVKRINILSLAKNFKIGVEEAGRKMRYEVFQSVASQETNSKIATAHTLSDNAETVIMRLISGTSLKGLCGIPPVRSNIIRPLIRVSRSEIERYCLENNLNYVVDSSNFQKNYTRNKIRLELMPIIKEINPSFERTIERMVFAICADKNYLEKKSDKIFEFISNEKNFNAKKVENLPLALKNRVLFKIIRSYTDKRIDQKHLNQLNQVLDSQIGKVCIPGNKVLVCKNGKLECEKNFNKNYLEWEYRISPLNVLTEIQTNIIINVMSISEYKNKLENNCLESPWAIDIDKLNLGSVFRNRRPGDMFKFSSRKISKSVKKIFNEMKIPLDQRYKIPILAYKNDIIWIDRVGVSKNYIPTEATKKVAIIIKE